MLPQSSYLSFSFSAVVGLVTQAALCVMAIEEAWRGASLATSPPPCSEPPRPLCLCPNLSPSAPCPSSCCSLLWRHPPHPASPFNSQPSNHMRVHGKSLQLCLSLCNSMDCSLPDFSVHGILQARVLEWVAIPSSAGSSRPRD